MAATPGLLYRGAAATGVTTVVASTIYTAPADGQTLVKSISWFNSAATATTANIYVVPAGTTGTTALSTLGANQLYGAATVTAAQNATLTLTPNVIMNPGDMLCVVASQAGANAFVSGVEHLGSAPGMETLSF